MSIGRRDWLRICGSTVAAAAVAGPALQAADNPLEDGASAKPAGKLTEEELGNMIRAMGVEPKLDQKRYDFAFKAPYNKEEWNLSMSCVLSENGNSLWVMAWLDLLPASLADVPRTALLRLLALNDKLGNGKFFSFIWSNKRFVMQRVVPNEEFTTAKFRGVLQDLGASVVETFDYWSTSGWNDAETKKPAGDSMPQNSAKSAPNRPASETQRTTGAASAPGKLRN